MANNLCNSSPQGPQLGCGRKITPAQDAMNCNITNSPLQRSMQPNININMELPVSNKDEQEFLSLINNCLTERGQDISDLADYVFGNPTEHSIDSSEDTSDMTNQEQNLISNTPASPGLYSDIFNNGNASFINPLGIVNENQIKPTINNYPTPDFMNIIYPNEDNVVDINNMPNGLTYNVPVQSTIPLNSIQHNSMITNFGENLYFTPQPIYYMVQGVPNESYMNNIQVCNFQPNTALFGNSAFVPPVQEPVNKEVESFTIPDEFNFNGANSALAELDGNIISYALNLEADGSKVEDEATEKMVDSFLTPVEDMETSQPIPLTQNMESKRMDSSVPTFDEEKILKTFKSSSFGNEEKICFIQNVKIVKRKNSLKSCKSFIPNTKICIEIGHNEKSSNKSTKMETEVIPSTSYASNRPNSVICENSTFKMEPVASTSYATTPLNITSPQRPMSSLGGAKPKRRVKAPSKYNTIAFNDLCDFEISEEKPPKKKKNTRISLDDLTDAEKYQRIRDQNNVASKKCREKKKEREQRIALETAIEIACNIKARADYAAIQNRVKKWKELYFYMVRQTQCTVK